MAKKVVVNDGCIGCGQCAEVCSAFVVNDENKAELVGEADDASIEESAASCPAQVIEIN